MNRGRARQGALLLLAALVLTSCGGKHESTTAVGGEVAAAVRLCDPGGGGSPIRTQVCLERKLLAIVSTTSDTATQLPLIDAAARRDGGELAQNCHIIMHWVGRNYALAHHVTLGSLQSFLPRSNNPACSAGFAHGLVSALGPAIRNLDPASVAAACAGSETRYQAYSCVHGLGHAYMRAYNEQLPVALRMCGRLPRNDVVDCAQGAFHDYWFSLSGVDGTVQLGASLRPRALCGRQPAQFVRACWYRAFMEFPPKRALYNADDIVTACAGLTTLQREGCITGASAISAFAHPSGQLAACASVTSADAIACVRGVPTQQLADSPVAAKVRLVEGCDRFGNSRAGCIEWLAKALNVVTDGSFVVNGCPALPSADRQPCRTGAATWRGPLETFS